MTDTILHPSRRHFLGTVGVATASAAIPFPFSTATGAAIVQAAPDNETYWREVASHYDMMNTLINVENGNWGVMARPVLDVYLENTKRVNRYNSYFARREYGPIFASVREQLAERLAVRPEEVALTRGATEALQNIIGGFNRIKPGDAVMYADLDYGSIQAAMRGLARKIGAELVELDIPEPTSWQGLIDFYAEAFDRHPNTRFLLLTHVSHRTGLTIPVKEIISLARERGIMTVVDAAHSWGQINFTLPDLGADFVGLNLHKWIGAPLGVGAMYIKREHLAAISPNISATEQEFDRIEGRVHTGTSNFAAYMTVPEAIAFHDRVGPDAKEARFRYLRDIWVSQCRDIDGIEILTPEDERLHAGITSFRIKCKTSADDNRAIAAYLLELHGAFSVHRDGVAKGACVRITPGPYNSAGDMRKVAIGIRSAARHFA